MPAPEWFRYPTVAKNAQACSWLSLIDNLGRSPATIDAYARGLDQYLVFCEASGISSSGATLEHVSLFVRYLRGEQVLSSSGRPAVSNATLQQRLTAVRLWYDHLVYQDVRERNPVPCGSAHFNRNFSNQHVGFRYGLVRRQFLLPRVPCEADWVKILAEVSQEGLRNRLMFAFAYYGALRREELIGLEVSDLDVARRLITIRAETSKGGRGRIVCYSSFLSPMLAVYLHRRRNAKRENGPLFLSESDRNFRQPITKWTWSKTIERISRQANVEGFSTHTLRHLRLTHLARSGWRLHDISTYAGHRNTQSTMIYIHLSGEDMLAKMAQSVDHIDLKFGQLLFSEM